MRDRELSPVEFVTKLSFQRQGHSLRGSRGRADGASSGVSVTDCAFASRQDRLQVAQFEYFRTNVPSAPLRRLGVPGSTHEQAPPPPKLFINESDWLAGTRPLAGWLGSSPALLPNVFVCRHQECIGLRSACNDARRNAGYLSSCLVNAER